MFKVLLVDDEPAALEYIQQIIEKRCGEFQVIGTAKSGEQGLEMLKRTAADILITDIKMTGMTGITLIEKIKEIDPSIHIMIISGYSDFEYAQKAIVNQVYDYILKPVDPMEFSEIMERLKKELRDRAFQKRTALLRAICKGTYIKQEELKRYFYEETYYAFLIRRNNFPNRFNDVKEADVVSSPYESIILYGRDENEGLYLIPENCLEKREDLKKMIDKVQQKYQMDQGFVTVIVQEKKFSINDMRIVIENLYASLYKNLVCGFNQIIYLDKNNKPPGIEKQDKESVNMIEHFLDYNEENKAKLELKKMCENFEKKRVPQLQVENVIRQICNFVWMSHGFQNYDSNTEYLLEDLFYSSTNMTNLYQSVSELLFQTNDLPYQKIDTPEYFEKIKQYVINHLSEPLTLNMLVKALGISQSHLSYMFRKYVSQSFNTYLTSLRMETAKEKLEQEPEILIRDVAQLAGYQDQFYFSRVFKLYTGMNPTEYAHKKEK